MTTTTIQNTKEEMEPHHILYLQMLEMWQGVQNMSVKRYAYRYSAIDGELHIC